ncbi:MAG: hypothetical protein WA984_03960 [Phormidesmis sp.]
MHSTTELSMPQQSTNSSLQTGQLEIGINLTSVSDWSTQYPFLNFFKNARTWATSAQGIWDTDELGKLDVDEDGWVRSIPKQGVAMTHLRTIVPNAPKFDRYVVRYKGEGTLTYAGDGGVYKDEAASQPGRDVIVASGSEPIVLGITSTDPNGNGNYIRDIEVVPEPFANLPDSQIFNPDFLDHLKGFETLRFMGWMQTNGSTQKEWRDRPQLADSAYATEDGVPLEVMIELANQTGIDPWFNMPHMATDDYVRNFAKMVRENLDPELKVYIEYSNEVWGAWEEAYEYATQQGTDRFGSSSQNPRIDFHAQRTSEIGRIWDQEFGSQKDRTIGVLGANHSEANEAKIALDYIRNTGMSLAEAGIDKLAVAPYFGTYFGSAENQPDIQRWMQDSDGGLSKLFKEITEGGQLEHGGRGGALQLAYDRTQQNIDVANEAGIEVIAYEGGQHLVGLGSMQENQALTDLLIEANRDPRMGEIYREYFAKWDEQGGGLFADFTDVKPPSKYGSWGSKENLYDEGGPKWDAVQDLIEASAQRPVQASMTVGDDTTVSNLNTNFQTIVTDDLKKISNLCLSTDFRNENSTLEEQAPTLSSQNLPNFRGVGLDSDSQLGTQVGLSLSDISGTSTDNNTVDFYTVENADGAVLDELTGRLVQPGEASYAELVLNQWLKNTNLIRDVIDLGEKVASDQILASYKILAPYSRANGAVEFLLTQNAGIQWSKINAYAAIADADSDGVTRIPGSADQLTFENL